MDDLPFTSDDFMGTRVQLEDEFEVEIDEQEAVKIITVQQAVDYLEKLTSGK